MDVPPDLLRVKQAAEAELLARPGVTGVDIGFKEVGGKPTGTLAIRVLVAEKKAVPKTQLIPSTIEGIPTDVIERKFELHQLKVAVTEITPQADTVTYDPLKGGISVGPCRSVGGFVYAGTLGCLVKDNASGQFMLLSNFHVMCVDTGWSVGDTMTQPSLIDTGSCPGSVVGTLARASLGGSVDCAVALQTQRGDACEVADIGAVAGTNVASLGLAVRKRGRTTGLTYGTVDAVALTVSLDYGNGLGVVTLTNQIGIAPTAANPKFGDHGDSGSVVVNNAGEVVGLYFAGDSTGYGVANPIADVASALNVTVCTATGTTSLYRYWNPGIGDHFYTTNWSELGGGNYGWNFEGVQCYVLAQQASGSRPLYRYWNSGIGDHFYTTNWSELGGGNYGWNFEEVQCYVL